MYRTSDAAAGLERTAKVFKHGGMRRGGARDRDSSCGGFCIKALSFGASAEHQKLARARLPLAFESSMEVKYVENVFENLKCPNAPLITLAVNSPSSHRAQSYLARLPSRSPWPSSSTLRRRSPTGAALAPVRSLPLPRGSSGLNRSSKPS